MLYVYEYVHKLVLYLIYRKSNSYDYGLDDRGSILGSNGWGALLTYL